MLKRAFDLVVSTIGIVILLPLWIIMAFCIKVDSHGSVFYIQDRIGRNGKPFKLYKFRTMKERADRQAPITIGSRDARITRVGYFLRKYKMDELAQLLNVFLGDMSLVGPRPELAKFVELYTERQKAVLLVRPGITDLASIAFRNESEMLEGKTDPIQHYIDTIMPEKLDMNIKYIETQSFWIDVKIIFKTLFLIFK